ncbi:hypothetical protein LOD99_3271 [Oopsacas minuta]|uniref:Mic1 domain-containing protein n=1 Tax=Oopsacas minuta TaxID=111878 RepID=A0AAV7JXZ6_9METZ|nr:hypothetical protein LOD99_3271 [Oopsacas minuta]
MSHYIELIQIPSMTFEPISKVKNVFYDEVNNQILVLKSGGSEVVIRGPEDKLNVKVTVPHVGGLIQSIKFSPNQEVLGVLRHNKNIDFVSFKSGEHPKVYSHSSKGKQQIEQFYWTDPNELVIITNSGFEYYTWLHEQFKLKLCKSHNVRVMRWFYYNSHEKVLIFPSPNPSSLTLHTFLFKRGALISRIPDFDVDCPLTNQQEKFNGVSAGQISLVSLYLQLYLVIIKNNAEGPESGAYMLLYRLEQGPTPSLTHILKMDVSGIFALNTLDNLLVVHHQGSKISMLFDVCQLGHTILRGAKVIGPIVPPLPMATPRPIGSGSNLERFPVKAGFSDNMSKEMYSQNWITFPPHIVLDVKWGRYMEVSLKLDVICQVMFDKVKLIEFLLRRQESQSIIMSVISQSLIPGRQSSIVTIARVLDRINDAFVRKKSRAALSNPFRDVPTQILSVISQEEMYRQVFSALEASMVDDHKFVVSVLMEYIRSLHQHDQEVEHYLFEMVLSILVRQRAFGQLHQLLQYHVIADSKPIACVLLAFEREYRPALQLALDMFKRLSTADEEIIEVLLSHNQILPALRYIRSIGKTDVVSSRLFLDAAAKTKDKMLFHTVYKFFEERNIRLRKNAHFPTDEHCLSYEELYNELFPKSAASPTIYERKTERRS